MGIICNRHFLSFSFFFFLYYFAIHPTCEREVKSSMVTTNRNYWSVVYCSNSQFPFSLLFLLFCWNLEIDQLGLGSNILFFFFYHTQIKFKNVCMTILQQFEFIFYILEEKSPQMKNYWGILRNSLDIHIRLQFVITMADAVQKQSTIEVSSGITKKPQKKICCACPTTKTARDECVVKFGEAECKEQIEAHLRCLRSEGFNV